MAFLPVDRGQFNNVPVPPNWPELIEQRIDYWPDPQRGVDVSLRNYIHTTSQGRADIQGVVQDVFPLSRQDVPPDFLAGQFEQQFRSEGFDAAALVMLGGQGAGQASGLPGYWARFVMAEGVGVWAMELTHAIAGYADLYTNDRANDLNGFDNMDCACGTHPTAYTKVALGCVIRRRSWLTRQPALNLNCTLWVSCSRRRRAGALQSASRRAAIRSSLNLARGLTNMTAAMRGTQRAFRVRA